MTSAPRRGVMGGDENTMVIVDAGRRNSLAETGQGCGGGEARRTSRGQFWRSARDVDVDIRIKRLPHGEGLPLPAYQSAGAAGLDLVAAVPADAPLTLPPGGRALAPTGLVLRFRPASRRRSAALRPRPETWRDGAQLARHDRQRLPRRGGRHSDQSWRQAL